MSTCRAMHNHALVCAVLVKRRHNPKALASEHNASVLLLWLQPDDQKMKCAVWLAYAADHGAH